MFSKNAYIETILENATIGHIVITELVAMDEDTPVDQLTFSMTPGLPFKINETTGRSCFTRITQLTFTCSTSAIETMDKGVKYVQS